MNRLTLIGGAPLSGKTTLSKQIAKEDGAVELSTDSIRSWMKKLVGEKDYPGLHYAEGLTAEEFYEKYLTPQSVVDGEIAEGKQVEKGILALLETEISWDHLVVEGIALSPEFMKRVAETREDMVVETIVLADEDKGRITERISTRGLWGPRGTYPDSLVPKEVEWVVLYNQWFLEQAGKCNIEIRRI